jgi:hypothetical protein
MDDGFTCEFSFDVQFARADRIIGCRKSSNTGCRVAAALLAVEDGVLGECAVIGEIAVPGRAASGLICDFAI